MADNNDYFTTEEGLERVFLRLVMVSSDEQLRSFTSRFLMPLLRAAEAGSPRLAKLSELLTHYNKRVRNNSTIPLPVSELLELIREKSGIQTNLALIYLRFAQDRMSPAESSAVFPAFLRAIRAKASPPLREERMELLALCLPSINALAGMEKKLWPEDLKMLHNVDEALLVQELKRFFSAALCFHFDKGFMKHFTDLVDQKKREEIQELLNEHYLHSISPADYALIAKKAAHHSGFSSVKLSIVRVLDRGLLKDPDALPLLTLASASPFSDVSEAAEGVLKRVDLDGALSDRQVIDFFFFLYLGSAVDKKNMPDLMNSVTPASTTSKAKLMAKLRRSEVAKRAFMTNLVVARDAAKHFNTPRLQVSGLQFLLAIINGLPPTGAKVLAPPLFTELRGFLSDSYPDARAVIFRCLAKLGTIHPPIVCGDMQFVQDCFEDIFKEDGEAVEAVVDCLVEWLAIFRTMKDPATRGFLQTIVAHYISHENSKCRMIALKYIEALLGPEQLTLHWMLIRACGDKREEMQREARRMLELSLSPALAPKMRSAVEEFFPKWNDIMTQKANVSMKETDESLAEKKEGNVLIGRTLSRFLWACGEVEVGIRKPTSHLLSVEDSDVEWKSILPKVLNSVFLPMAETPLARQTLDIFLYSAANTSGMHELRIATAALHALGGIAAVSAETRDASLAAAERLLRATPRIDIAAEAAQLYAVVLGDEAKRRTEAAESIHQLEGKECAPGIAWRAAALLSLCKRGEETLRSLRLRLLERLKLLTAEGYDRPSGMLDACLGATHSVLVTASETLALPAGTCTEMLDLWSKIALTRKDGFSTSARDVAARCIGVIEMATETETGVRQRVYEKALSSLYSIGEGPPRPELQFAVGEALFDLAAGELAPSRRNIYTQDDDDWKALHANSSCWPVAKERLSAIFVAAIDVKSAAPNHHLRRAVIIWLLMLSQKTIYVTPDAPSDHLLQQLQAVFVDGLSENDDFTQDIASKGLGMCYGVAGEELRKLLVANLMTSLTEGKSAKRTVQGDTPIFEGNQLGKTPDGQGLTTYKELCSLATEMNNPDLLYKFMQLAKHNAKWNAKKGAAFGFTVVFEQAKAELEPYVAKLVPKLYRYRYDPDASVQSSMKSIWSVLTSSRKNVVDEFADEISREIIPSLTNKEWRVRESSCLAYADLLIGHATPAMLTSLPECLAVIFRVQDDIKESVRLSAGRAAQAIEKICLREAASTNAQRSTTLLNAMLPILVEGAAHAPVAQNKRFCLLLLVELAKECPRALKPYLPLVIPCLLDAISEVEPTVLNYIAARAGAADLEELDDARSRAAGASPLMHACSNLVQFIDAEALIQLTPKLADQLRGSIGVSTRTATAQLVTHLSLMAPQLLLANQPTCDKFFSVLRTPALRDRNPSVRKQFSSTLSYLARFSSNAQMNSLILEARKELLGSEEEGKTTVRNLLRALSANASELLAGHASLLVPYVFLEKCQQPTKGDEESKKRAEAWAELWSELVPSTESAIRLYGKEILETALSILQEGQVWAVKAQAALMIKVAVSVKECLTPERSKSLLLSLLSLISGRYWTGKEKLPEAIGAVFDAAADSLSKDLSEQEKNTCLETLLREAGKKRQAYSLPCLAALSQAAAALRRADTALLISKRVQRKVDRTIKGESECTSSDEDADSSERSRAELEAERQARLAVAVFTVCTSLRAFREGEDATEVVGCLASWLLTPSVFYRVRQAIITGLDKFFEKRPSYAGSLDGTALALGLAEHAAEMAATQRRSLAVSTLAVLVRLVELSGEGSILLNRAAILQRLGQEDLKIASEIGLINRLQSSVGSPV